MTVLMFQSAGYGPDRASKAGLSILHQQSRAREFSSSSSICLEPSRGLLPSRLADAQSETLGSMLYNLTLTSQQPPITREETEAQRVRCIMEPAFGSRFI